MGQQTIRHNYGDNTSQEKKQPLSLPQTGTRQMDLSAAVQGKHLNSTAHPGAVVNWAWMEATGCTWSDTWHPQPEMGTISMPNHSHETGTISMPDHSHDWALGFSSGRNLPWILLEKSQQILHLLLSLCLSSPAIVTSLAPHRRFPEDRLGGNIFVSVWTDFLLMIHNSGTQSGNDDDLFPHLPLLMKRNCLWGWGQKVNSPCTQFTPAEHMISGIWNSCLGRCPRDQATHTETLDVIFSSRH